MNSVYVRSHATTTGSPTPPEADKVVAPNIFTSSSFHKLHLFIFHSDVACFIYCRTRLLIFLLLLLLSSLLLLLLVLLLLHLLLLIFPRPVPRSLPPWNVSLFLTTMKIAQSYLPSAFFTRSNFHLTAVSHTSSPITPSRGGSNHS